MNVAIAVVLITPAVQSQELQRRKLAARVVIDGITCAPTGGAYAEFHPSGRLAECPLANDTVMFGQSLPAMTWLGLTEAGLPRRAWLPRDTRLSGHLCHGAGYKGYSVEFYPSGQLKLCFLAADTEIEGIPCIRGTFWTEVRGRGRSALRLREDGGLQRCQASRTFARDGVTLRKWQVAALDPSGRLLAVK